MSISTQTACYDTDELRCLPFNIDQFKNMSDTIIITKKHKCYHCGGRVVSEWCPQNEILVPYEQYIICNV